MANLPSLVERLLLLIPEAEIVVVDDNSPDGTGRWCEQEAARNAQFHHLGRPGKQGLGSATLAGIKFGLDRGFDFIATMDADWSHDPQAVAEMWERIVQDRDGVVGESFGALIGSRYVKGGGIRGWPLFRRVVSRSVNAFTRLVLRLPTKDNTGALRIYRAAALHHCRALEITTRGYGYLEEMLFRMHRVGLELWEHPITFVDRQAGKSKASLGEGIRVISNILRIRAGR